MKGAIAIVVFVFIVCSVEWSVALDSFPDDMVAVGSNVDKPASEILDKQASEIRDKVYEFYRTDAHRDHYLVLPEAKYNDKAIERVWQEVRQRGMRMDYSVKSQETVFVGGLVSGFCPRHCLCFRLSFKARK